MNRLIRLSRSERLILVLSLLLVFGIRSGYAGLVPPRSGQALNVDRWGTIARNLVEGQGYVYPYFLDKDAAEPVAPNAQRGPVPVLFFAGLFWLFGRSLWPVLVAQWLLDCGTAYLLYRIALETFHDRTVGWLAIVGFALYIPEVSITTFLYSEPLFTFLLAGFMVCLMQALARGSLGLMASSGVLFGLSALSQPIVLLLPIILLPGLLLRYRRLTTALPHFLVLVSAFVLSLIPWAVRNYIEFQVFTPSTALFGFNLIVDHYNLGQDNFIPEIGRKIGMDKEVNIITRQILARQGLTVEGRSPMELDRLRADEAFRLIAQYPGRYLILCLHRLMRLWFNVGYGAPPSLRSTLVMALNTVLLTLMTIQVIAFRGAWLRTAWPLLTLIAYFTLVYSAIHAQVRYIFPVIPYVILMACACVRNIMWKISRD